MVFLVFLWLACAFLCGYIAQEKRRDRIGWFIGGLFLGVFALIAIASVPKLEEKEVTKVDERRLYKP